jgi:phenylacetate-CoA ligase
VIHVELREEVTLEPATRAQLADTVRQGVIAHLARVSRDFAESLRESDRAREVRVRVHDAGTGPFTGSGTKLKRVYLRQDRTV